MCWLALHTFHYSNTMELFHLAASESRWYRVLQQGERCRRHQTNCYTPRVCIYRSEAVGEAPNHTTMKNFYIMLL